MISVFAVYSASAVLTTIGVAQRSTLVTLPWMISVPNLSACARISPIRSGPMMPSRYPGKFSTIGRQHQLTAGLEAFDEERLQVGARGVESGGQARGA